VNERECEKLAEAAKRAECVRVADESIEGEDVKESEGKRDLKHKIN
jgi:hypothetical protein